MCQVSLAAALSSLRRSVTLWSLWRSSTAPSRLTRVPMVRMTFRSQRWCRTSSASRASARLARSTVGRVESSRARDAQRGPIRRSSMGLARVVPSTAVLLGSGRARQPVAAAWLLSRRLSALLPTRPRWWKMPLISSAWAIRAPRARGVTQTLAAPPDAMPLTTWTISAETTALVLSTARTFSAVLAWSATRLLISSLAVP
mmetsp:Transcript_7652/g.19669  ORF Transcript_7652/g.19669 Transcript_7652/m.19669 type:complete len:201 (-) Transcript_7652:574-1176(-)